MKKTIIIMTTLAALLCTAPLTTTTNTFASEFNDYASYYDLNNDGQHNISDAVLAKRLLQDKNMIFNN